MRIPAHPPRFLGFLLPLILFSACLSSENAQQQEYRFVYTNLWAGNPTPLTNFPDNGGYGELLVVNHTEDFKLWSAGRVATVGFGEYVRQGERTNLDRETSEDPANDQIFSFNAHNLITSGENTVTLTLNRDFPYLSLAARINPSQDWFVGIDSLKLFQDGSWISQSSGKLEGYDAGTNTGIRFTDLSSDQFPSQPIAKMNGLIPFDSSTMPTDFEFLDYRIERN